MLVDLSPVIGLVVASRVLVLLAARFGTRHVPIDPTSPPPNLAAPPWFRWDALAYLDIATHGYADALGTAWFPVYPILGRALAAVTGLPVPWALLTVSYVAFVASAFVLFELAQRELGRQAAVVAVASLCFFPTTVFFSAGYAESLFVLISALTFLCLRSGKLWPAAMLAGLAAGCRPLGWALAASVVVEAAVRSETSGWWGRVRLVPVGLVAIWGLLAYMTYVAFTFGHPTTFIRINFAWGAERSPVTEYLPWRLADAIVSSGSRDLMVNATFFVGAVVVTALTARSLPLRYTVFSVSILGFVYWVAPHLQFQSVSRYVLALLPLHLGIARLTQTPSAALTTIPLLAGLSVFWTILYSQGYPIR